MIPDSATSFSPQNQISLRTIRPIAAAAIHGISFRGNELLAIDSTNGYLLQIDPRTDETKILNPQHWLEFRDAKGLAISGDTLWFTKYESVYFTSLNGEITPQHFVTLPYEANGVAVLDKTIYVTCEQYGSILIFSQETGREITRLYAPGIGIENITVKGEELWICDATEQTVYCLDRATGKLLFSVLTPFENPTGLAFYPHPKTGEEILYVAYAFSEPYIRDNPNADPNHELQYRDRTFVHPLYFHYNREKHYALSNGYLVEMSYVEEISPLEDIELKALEWRIALPAETDRQKVKKIEFVGLPFTEEVEDGQRVAVFKFDTLSSQDRLIFGWKALLEVWSIKYQVTPGDCEYPPELSPNYQERYLVDDDDLAMDSPIIIDAAQEAVGTETNLLRKMYSIRNYVYDRLSYGIKPYIDTPDVALERGVGSCGEYLGILLALSRLNGIACRTVGRYKCPAQPHLRGLPLEPDFNHVWMEFYVPGIGWLPMESNPDDISEGGPYPTRFFMGLAWYHAEMAKGVSFEKLISQGVPVDKEKVSIGELAINHVSFTILAELKP
ncbi:MAG: transglutaminase [Kamptonema sp. SIO1D9]|nr:transglutaminase [Kamptonema sp. SIO1D9]